MPLAVCGPASTEQLVRSTSAVCARLSRVSAAYCRPQQPASRLRRARAVQRTDMVSFLALAPLQGKCAWKEGFMIAFSMSPLTQSAAASTAPAAGAAAPSATDAKLAAVQADLERLSASKVAWARASLDDRIAILKEIRGRILDQVHPRARGAGSSTFGNLWCPR